MCVFVHLFWGVCMHGVLDIRLLQGYIPCTCDGHIIFSLADMSLAGIYLSSGLSLSLFWVFALSLLFVCVYKSMYTFAKVCTCLFVCVCICTQNLCVEASRAKTFWHDAR